MKNKVLFIAVSLLIAGLMEANCLAQGAGQEFFNRDFAKDAGVTSQDEADENRPKDILAPHPTEAAVSDDENEKEDGTEGEEGEKEDSLEEGVFSAGKIGGGQKIESLSLIVRAEPESHLIKTVDTYHELLKKRQFPGGTVYIYKRPPGYYNMQLMKLMSLSRLYGAQSRNISKLPEKYAKDIKYSPVWIITLADGEVVIDGAKSPKKFLNAKGEYVKNDSALPREEGEEGEENQF